MFEALEQRASDYIAAQQPVLSRLGELGISLDEPTVKTSHIVVTYPPKQVLDDRSTSKMSLPQTNNPKALYVHIPFCTGICSYCGYARSARPADPEVDAYLDLLEKESSLVRQALGGARIPVESIYIGGGTPTLLTDNQLIRLFEMIRRDFDLPEGAEYSLEGSPETIDVGAIELAKRYGVNRVSIGVESFDDGILQSVRRRHTGEEAKQALYRIREGGIANIDLDLMRGLPGYTSQLLTNDLQDLAGLRLPSVTSYQYEMKPGSIDFKRSLRAIVESQLHHVMFLLGMEEMGYQHASPLIDCFTLNPDAVYRHNEQKWGKLSELVSLGRGAYSNIGNVQFINFEDRKLYRAAIESGRLPIEKATVLSQDEMMHRHFVMGLKAGVNRAQFMGLYGIDASEAPFGDTIRRLVDAGAITETREAFTISQAGIIACASSVQTKFYSAAVMQSCAAVSRAKIA